MRLPSLLLLLSAVCASVACARPVLQPDVKEYAELGGTSFPAGRLTVWHQDQAQCRIGAEEIDKAAARRVWDGASTDAENAVYVAVQGSPAADRLVAAFGLDVPDRQQGYAIRAENGRVAIVGRDPVGALYGCVTFRQMSAEGSVENAAIRDWPDFLRRGQVNLWGGLRRWGVGEDRDLRREATKRAFDEMLRHKLNAIEDFHYKQPDEREFPVFREWFDYAAERGIYPAVCVSSRLYGRVEGWNFPPPEGFDKWPCVKQRMPNDERCWCWADDKLTEMAANRYADMLVKYGATNVYVEVHPVDFGGLDNPEGWNNRCAKCRARWADDERWKATANQLVIWSRVIRRRIPSVRGMGTCAYPYTIALFDADESEKTPQWRQNVEDFYRKTDRAIADPDFWFDSWIANGTALAEFRKVVPTRPLLLGSPYPLSAGIFETFHRKAGTLREGVQSPEYEQHCASHCKWESLLLAAEYLWNAKAPGSETFDGRGYYDPRVDHTGPKVVVEKLLPAICRTFYGAEMTPDMVEFLTSGVLPQYLRNPSETVRYFNLNQQLAIYDFTGGAAQRKAKAAGVKWQPFVDDVGMMRDQVARCDRAAAAIGRARRFADGLDFRKRRYFNYWVRLAPYWLATARARLGLRESEALARSGDFEGARRTFAAADARRRADFAAADANAADLRKRGEYDVEPVSDRWPYTAAVAEADYARMSTVIAQIEPPSSEEDVRRIAADRAAACERAYAEAAKNPPEAVRRDGTYPVETWKGERVVDGLVKVHDRTLRIEPGATVRFTATGRLVVTGNFEAFGATFEGEGTAITNDWRILTSCGGVRIEGCTFRNLPAVRNRGWGWGFMRLGGGAREKRPVIVRASRFENTAGFGIMQSADDRIELNSFVGGSGGVVLLEGLSTRVTGNVFKGLSDTGVQSDGARLPTIDGNVFENCYTALVAAHPAGGYMVGNIVTGGTIGLRAHCDEDFAKEPILVSGNWFKGQSRCEVLYRKPFHAKAVLIPPRRASAASEGGEKPLWTAGLMTDTHVGPKPESCARVRKACELFAERGVDLVANTGDIADEYCEEGYHELRRTYDRAFAGRKPHEIWVYANHDTNDGANRPKEVLREGMRKALGIAHDPYSVTDFRGYPLVTVPQSYNYDRTAKMLQDVCADPKWAGKPVFVFDHVPPMATTENSVTWGQAGRRELYSRFPRAVVIGGHAHGSLRSEQNIWQGEFTALGLGCLQHWSGHAVGGAPEDKDSYDVAILEVYPNRLVIRRFDIRDKSEYRASDPWCVPLPFDPKTAPYRRERTVRTEPVPQFGKGAALKLTPVGAPCTSVRLDFPAAEGPNGTYQYRLEIIDERGVKFARQDVFGQFWLPERDRRAVLSQELSAGYFESGRRSRVVVTPVNAFGIGGKSLEADLLMPSPVGAVLWETTDPMGDCPFRTGLADGSPVPLKDGWYLVGTGDHRLEFPASAWNCPIGTRMRVTVDLEMEQPELRTWTMVLRHPTPLANATSRIATPQGAPGVQRYVMEFKKWQSDYYLLIREGSPGRIRFHRIRVERIDGKRGSGNGSDKT